VKVTDCKRVCPSIHAPVDKWESASLPTVTGAARRDLQEKIPGQRKDSSKNRRTK